jgi:hypothetical protein
MTGVPFKRLLGTYPNARLAVEVAFGADLTADPATWVWFDVTTDVMFTGGLVNITPMGRGDETSKAQPAGCKFQLLNTSGAYSKANPVSPYYPNVRRNTPVRVRVTLDNVTWYTQFQGQANGFTPAWNTKGNVPTVAVSASGKLRQLQQGKTPLRSTLYRATVGASTLPFAYWPLEDGTSATVAGSGLPGGTPMTLNTPPGAVLAPKWAQTEVLAGSQKIIYLGDSYLYAPVAGTIATSWRVDWVVKYDVDPTGDTSLNRTEMVRVYTANGVQWRVYSDTAEFYVSRITAAGTETTGALSTFTIYDGVPHHLGIVISQSGGNINAQLFADDSLIFLDLGLLTGETLAAVTGIQVGSDQNYAVTDIPKPSIGHLTFFDGNPVGVTLYNASIGYTGELAVDRLARLCDEEGVELLLYTNGDAPSPAMGPQGIDTFVNLLRDCETTDDGVLVDGAGPGLRYFTRGYRYNATAALTADVATTQVGDPFAPADDDQRDRNLIKASRKNGSSATYEDDFSPLGTQAIGVYDAEVTVNTSTDDGLPFRAAWEVHKGTVDAPYRYPTLNLDLGAVPALAPSWLLADVSSRINVTNVASKALQHPPGDIDLLLEGWAETLSPFVWTVAGNCSPFQPWRVAVIEGAGDTALRIDSGSSTLAAGAAAGATSISVASSNPVEVWSTAGGDYPRYVDVRGVKVRVTAVAGASSPQTFTTDPLPYPLTAGWQVKLWRPPTIAL